MVDRCSICRLASAAPAVMKAQEASYPAEAVERMRQVTQTFI